MPLTWRWEPVSPTHANYGNANQWAVGAGMRSLARETAQNSNDAGLGMDRVDIVYSIIRLSGEHRRAFEDAIAWSTDLRPHLQSMAQSAHGSVAAKQIADGIDVLNKSNALMLLRIDDYGCRGLGGPEYADVPEEDFGDFVKLCRLDLFSGKDAGAGGSFGLGKAVYWRFSRIQTALFASVLSEPYRGDQHNRVFGVQQGAVHDFGSSRFQGLGHFGEFDAGLTRSDFIDDATARSLHLYREDPRPGTSALVVGFYDPESADAAANGRSTLMKLAKDLRAGIEESFWPALTRDRMRVRVDVFDNEEQLLSDLVDPGDTFSELVGALRRYDAGDVDEALSAAGDVVVRDIPIKVPERRDPSIGSFVHQAKLIVTLSDDAPDSLENQVCLIRKPEMVVETLPRQVEGRKYHAFLLAGMATRPNGGHHTEDLRADDFLRYAEPPPHDRWIPRAGSRQVSQVNLDGTYVRPWKQNLTDIEVHIFRALNELLAAPLPGTDVAPTSVLKRLRFLPGEPGSDGGRGPGPAGSRKPTVRIVSGWVEDGQWIVDFEVRAQNRDQGWSVAPRLALIGMDGSAQLVDWDRPLELLSGTGSVIAGSVVLPHTPDSRIVKAQVRGVSQSSLPVPATEALVDVVIRHVDPAPGDAA